MVHYLLNFLKVMIIESQWKTWHVNDPKGPLIIFLILLRSLMRFTDLIRRDRFMTAPSCLIIKQKCFGFDSIDEINSFPLILGILGKHLKISKDLLNSKT